MLEFYHHQPVFQPVSLSFMIMIKITFQWLLQCKLNIPQCLGREICRKLFTYHVPQWHNFENNIYELKNSVWLYYFKTSFILECSLIWLLLFSRFRLHGLYPSRLLCPWDVQGKIIRVGCHFLLRGGLPSPGIKLSSPALAGGFFITETPEKPHLYVACVPALFL